MTLLTKKPDEVLERIAPLLVRPFAEVEQEAIESAMILCGGRLTLAARRLRVSRSTLIRKLARYRKADA